ncbi:efflux RND transporter permease subunit [Alterisphingorhabdus coralli]|uniref:Efflux RND transporter permease subunit n=1 Tax=Alterisphingorhabdus coralli TaxID=3071408 RepID=A0AA97F5V6_9SPHN|nr:efflux RND transporter permease subunit [Parasphingorhabdus sp. SCSIO 66989]WOE73883.1 efflux RND transporter permease subunit [Parasphingorhabdus sp. SCSIO 66989]
MSAADDNTPPHEGNDAESASGVVDRHGEIVTERARDRGGAVAFMARNGVAANLLMMFLFVTGIIAYGTIVQEVTAEASLDTIQVRVVYPGATPQEVEESIIQKAEEAVEAIENVKSVTSTANEGVGSVLVELELGANLPRALDDVKSEIDQIQTFPAEAEEPEVSELTTRQSVMRIAIYGETSERTLKEIAYGLEDSIAALDEVSYVQTSAVRDYEILIDVPQNTLRSLGLSLTDISRTVGASSLDTPAGAIETTDKEVRVRTVGQNYNQQNFEDIVLLATREGTKIRLGDVATIEDGFEDNDLITRYNGQPVAFVDVYRTSDERVLDVAEAVRFHLEEEFAPSLPDGISYAIWEDNSELLNDRLGLLLDNATLGLILVLVALTLFLDSRLALWTAVGIAATFVGAIFVLEFVGSSINMFSLFGFILALGLVVDDAVVVGENIYAERERGRTGMGAAIAGAQRVTMPVIFAVATTIAAFSPLFAVEGVIGKILSDIPVVIMAVLSLSLIEALLVLPHHLSHLPPPGAPPGNPVRGFLLSVQEKVDTQFQRFVNGPLDKALRFSVTMPYVVLAGAMALLIVAVALIPAGIIKFQFFPDLEADRVTATLELPAGATTEQTERVVQRIEAAGARALKRLDEEAGLEDGESIVRGLYTTVGLVANQGGPTGVEQQIASNIARVEYSLLPGDLREISAASFEEAWREELGPVPEAQSFTITSALFSIGEPVNVQLTHPDTEDLERATNELMSELGRFSGVFNIESDQDEGMQEIELRLKPSARTLGVTLQDVASQVRAAFFGSEAVRVQRGREDVRVYVRLPEDERDSIADVQRFRVRVPGGDVALGSLADVSFSQAPSVIRREDGRRITTVTADVDVDVITGQEVARQLEREIVPRLQNDYPGLTYAFGGEQEEQQSSFDALLGAFGIAMIVVYALLAIPFRSYVQPLIIMAAIPFGMIGALIGHLVLGLSLGILSMFGLIALSGVIINGSLVMIDFTNENLERGMKPAEAVVAAAKSRFRPIFLTALTTFLGVAPITFETSIQAQFLIPMSASLGFGVLFGTLILQVLVPALVVVQDQAVNGFKRWFRSLRDVETAPAE